MKPSNTINGKTPEKIKKGLDCKYGRWTVVADNGWSENGHKLLLCRCECGTEKVVQKSNLESGRSRSCGCLRREVSTEHSTTHGLSHTRLFKIWSNMRNRCGRATSPDYKYYGGRGIKVCVEWVNDFEAFYSWAVSNGYERNLTIDRIDVNDDYKPSNCRWVTMKDQAQNRRCSIRGAI